MYWRSNPNHDVPSILFLRKIYFKSLIIHFFGVRFQNVPNYDRFPIWTTKGILKKTDAIKVEAESKIEITSYTNEYNSIQDTDTYISYVYQCFVYSLPWKYKILIITKFKRKRTKSKYISHRVYFIDYHQF